MFGFKTRRRARYRQEPFPEEWRALLKLGVPYFNHLSFREQELLIEHIKVFLHEKTFEGCAGMEITAEIRVLVAAHACILILHQPNTDYYPLLQSILVYPKAFVVKQEQKGSLSFLVEESYETHAGEAWQKGVVILAWDGMLQSINHEDDGYNVAFHEFAHQLDMETGNANGLPILDDQALQHRWGPIFQQEYEVLRTKVAQGKRTVINTYGATNPAEFFAVLTECFFEIPRRLKRHHPELYDALNAYYRQDPATFLQA